MVPRKAFFTHVRRAPFDGRLSQAQASGLEAILAAWHTCGDGSLLRLAYVLATAWHETGGRMVPVREGFARSDAQARRIVRHRRYGKPAGPYKHVYYGRGQVQLTWHANYVDSSADAGVDLERYPDRMLDPLVSARVLVRGMLDGRWNRSGKGLKAYLNNHRRDFKNARRTVNLTDRWKKIAAAAQAFEAALNAATQGISPVQKAPAMPPKPHPHPQTPDPQAIEKALRQDGSRTIRTGDTQEKVGRVTSLVTIVSALGVAFTQGLERLVTHPVFLLVLGLALGAAAGLFYQSVLARRIRRFRVEDAIHGFAPSRLEAVEAVEAIGQGADETGAAR